MLIGYNILYRKKTEIKGKVIDETKNTLVVMTDKGLKRVIKENSKIIVYIGDREVKIRGNDIMLRPWEYAIR